MFAAAGNLPRFNSFADAQAYMERTTPIRTGSNKGKIPLHESRGRPDIYNIRMEMGLHPMQDRSEPSQRVIHCRYYRTDIVSFYEDGAIRVDGSYDSTSTNNNQTALLPRPFRVGSVVNRKQLFAAAVDVFESPEARIFRLNGGYSVFPFFSNNDIVLLPMSSGKYIVCGHGYYAGQERKYHDQIAGKFIRQAQKQLLALYRMSSRDTRPDVTNIESGFHDIFKGVYREFRVTARDFERAHKAIHEIISDCGWVPGEPVPSSAIDQLMMYSQQNSRSEPNYLDRMAHWGALRTTLRCANSCLSTTSFEVLSEQGAVELEAAIEKAQARG